MGMGQSWLIMDGVFMANGLGIYDLNGCGSYGKAGCCFAWKYAQKKLVFRGVSFLVTT